MSDDDAPDFPYLAIIITLKSNPDSLHFYGSPDFAVVDTLKAHFYHKRNRGIHDSALMDTSALLSNLL